MLAPAMESDIVGRDQELAAIDAFLDQPQGHLAGLVLEGQPGIGKSTLWRAAVERARRRGHSVLLSRPARAERSLPHVVLGDLLGDVASDILDGLPGPRRRAVDAALLRSEPAPADPLALPVAVRSILERLAEAKPLVIAIDDEQWIDPASRGALQFALRRLTDTPIRLVLARRTEESREGLERVLPDARISRVGVGPLSIGALQVLVRERLGTALGRRALLRVHEASAGNPFYGLELARALLASPGDASGPLPVPPTLEAVIGSRLDGLDADVAATLLLVAAAGRVTPPLARALGLDRRVVDRAAGAALLTADADAIVLSHPLLASAVYRRAGDEDRRAAHAQLAAAAFDPVERARHRSLAARGPDPLLSAQIAAEAASAQQRGWAFAAAELADHALRLTPDAAHDDRHERALAAARAHLAAGSGARARALLESVLEEAGTARERAEAQLLLSEIAGPNDAVSLLEHALSNAAGHAALQATVHARLAEAGRLVNGRAWAEAHADAALVIAEELGDPTLRAMALTALVPLRFDRGAVDTLDLAQAAYDLAQSVDDQRLVREAAIARAHLLAWSGDLDLARTFIEEELARWADRDEQAKANMRWYLALVELWAGRWDVADAHAQAAVDIWSDYGIEIPQMLLLPALLALHRGDFATARIASERALAMMVPQRLSSHEAVLALCAAWTGATDEAIERFGRAEAAADARGSDDPALREWRADYAETLVGAGRTDEADELVEPWAAAADALGRKRVSAHALRARGHVAMGRGDLAIAARRYELAAEAHRAVSEPFGAARAMHSLGIVRRRLRQKAAARSALLAALETFEALGALSWAAAAAAELARIGGRSRIDGLSESERRVAELVAEGRTNREVARALYLGERTVASHLTHAYAKLGIRSRTELAHLVGAGGEGDEPAHVISDGPEGKVPPS